MKIRWMIGATAMFLLLAGCKPEVIETSTPTPTRTPEPTPTEVPSPCELLSRDELEAIMGSITNVPAYESVDSGTGDMLQGCYFESDETFNSLLLSFAPSTQYSDAYAIFFPDYGEAIEGLGEEAFWYPADDSSGDLYILNGNITIIVNLYSTFSESSESVRDIAIQIGELTLQANPVYPLSSGVMGAVDLCTEMPRDQVEAILGPLNYEPEYSGYYDDIIGQMEGCAFYADDEHTWVDVTYGPLNNASAAQSHYDERFNYYRRANFSGFESIEGGSYPTFVFVAEGTSESGYMGMVGTLREDIAVFAQVRATSPEAVREIGLGFVELAIEVIPE